MSFHLFIFLKSLCQFIGNAYLELFPDRALFFLLFQSSLWLPEPIMAGPGT